MAETLEQLQRRACKAYGAEYAPPHRTAAIRTRMLGCRNRQTFSRSTPRNGTDGDDR
jgi:hypothetical protein